MPTTRDDLAQRLGGKREVAVEQVARAHAQVKLPRKLRDADVADYVVVHPGISKIQPRMQRRAEELWKISPWKEMSSRRSPLKVASETRAEALSLSRAKRGAQLRHFLHVERRRLRLRSTSTFHDCRPRARASRAEHGVDHSHICARIF
jgi:hypothetical protein